MKLIIYLVLTFDPTGKGSIACYVRCTIPHCAVVPSFMLAESLGTRLTQKLCTVYSSLDQGIVAC